MNVFEEAYGLVKSVVALPFEPVVDGGYPKLFRAIFGLCGFAVIGLGLSSVIVAITDDWTVAFAKIENEYVDTLAYPDLYMCIPAAFAMNYKEGGENYMSLNAFGDKGTVRTACGMGKKDASMPTRINLESLKLAGKITNKTSDSCPYNGAAAPSQGSTNINFGCESSSTATDCVSPNQTAPMAARVAMLLANLANYTDDQGNSFSPLCVGYEARGLSQSRTDKRDYQIFLEMTLSKPDSNQPFYMGYLMEKGKPPVVNGNIVATSVMFSGAGGVSGAQLQMQKIKDQTKGETTFTQEWKYNLWSKSMFEEKGTGQTKTYPTDYNKAYIGFWYSSFVVRKITIRYKTFQEIYSALGGIWAASVAILGYLFVKSGSIDEATQKEAYVFKYLPSSKRIEWLNQFTGMAKGARSASTSSSEAKSSDVKIKVDNA